MCGFSASISVAPLTSNNQAGDERQSRESLASNLKASVDAIRHRGPDDSDVWVDASGLVGLAHCRLSINDLSPAGRQPLQSDDSLLHAVVNGEIYDYDRLRNECEASGYVFQSDSDSELVLALYKLHGAPKFLEHLRGEFAFVLFDERDGQQKVIAGRDRFGIKPLVYTQIGSRLLAASEAKAFLPLGWKPRWDVRSITTAGWMLDDRTLFRGVRKVLPGHYLEIIPGKGIRQVKYWDAEYEDKTKIESRSIDEMVAGVRERLIESVRLRLRADVPVGIYLSGGIDSSAIAGIVTSLAREQNVKIGNDAATSVTCFSVAFPETSGYDESGIAERTADWLGVKTVKREIDESTLARDFADAVFHCEHHHFDLNFVAKFALSTLPQEHGVKVVLTGEGADEHFAGYPYFPPEYLREPDLALPDYKLTRSHDLRKKMFSSAQAEMNGIWRKAGGAANEKPSAVPSIAGPGAVSMSDNLLPWHPGPILFSAWVQDKHSAYDCRRTVLASHPSDIQAKMRSRWHPLHTAMYMWNKNSLANVLLSCLGDRTEMAHSIEARTPFLDHHLAEYVNRLPPSVKLRYSGERQETELGPIWTDSSMALQSFHEKWILREAAKPFITEELYKRKKHPFLAPARWAKDGPLHNAFKGILTTEAVENLGFVNSETVAQAMETAWGDDAIPSAFRLVVNSAAWVVLSQRFGVAKAELGDWE